MCGLGPGACGRDLCNAAFDVWDAAPTGFGAAHWGSGLRDGRGLGRPSGAARPGGPLQGRVKSFVATELRFAKLRMFDEIRLTGRTNDRWDFW